MADHDIEGQMHVLLRLLTSPEWYELWGELDLRVESFASLGIAANTRMPSCGRYAKRERLY
jgi:hypothetical protein